LSQDNEVSIKATASADIQDLVAWTQAMKDATAALSDYTDVAAKASAIGGTAGPGGGVTAPDGTPGVPAAPQAPDTTPQAPGGEPADPDKPPSSDEEPEPPLTPQQKFQQGFNRSRRKSVVSGVVDGAVQGGFWGALGGGLAAGLSNQQQGGFGERSGRFLGRLGGVIGGPFGMEIGAKAGGLLGRGADAAAGYAGQLASQGTQLALGSSIMGFPMAAAQKYMQLSETIAQMNARFREVEGSVTSFGGVLSYTVERSAAMAAALGDATDVFTKRDFRAYAGYARANGLDPNATMASFGQMQAVNYGFGLDTGQQAQVQLAASAMGMGSGQQGQAMQLIAQLAQSRLEQTGYGDVGMAAQLAALPRDIFQPGWQKRGDTWVDPRARGQQGMNFLGQMDRLLTSRSGAGASTMMRAIGYGTGDMSYREMRRRMEEGISNPENLMALADYIKPRGESTGNREDYTYKFLEAMGRETGADFKAHQLDALTDLFSDDKRLAEFRARHKRFGGEEAMKFALEGMTDEQKALFKEQGYFGAGKGQAGVGEAVATRIESMMMKVGGPIAEVIPQLQTFFENMGDIMSNMSGLDWVDIMNRIVTALEEGSTAAAAIENPGQYVRQKATEAATNEADRIIDNTGKMFDTFLDRLDPRGNGAGGGR
jgi:hypothetical protein